MPGRVNAHQSQFKTFEDAELLVDVDGLVVREGFRPGTNNSRMPLRRRCGDVAERRWCFFRQTGI